MDSNKQDIENTSDEYQLLQTSKFRITKFADKCTQKNQHRTNSERTYWIKHIVHIFQIFANQAGYLQFNWCKSQTKQHALAEINLNNWKKHLPNISSWQYEQREFQLIMKERYNWLKIFELLAYLLVQLKEQVNIHDILSKEQTRINIVHQEETVQIKLIIGLDDSA